MRKLLSVGVVLSCMLAAPFGVLLHPARAYAAASTVVSLTFDDGRASQAVMPSMLDTHGMKGTFYINSDTVGTADHLSWGQLTAFAADGQEIAGHTLDHVDLTTVSATEAQRQVCEDRARLLKHGFAVTDFAYPYGEGYNSSTVRSIVQGCGYNSARRAWGLLGPSCTTCWYPYADSIPPADYWGVRTADNPQVDTTLATIESFVTQAETHGGGWVPLVFHDICDACDQYSTTQAMLQAFLDWLQPRAANGTIVKTMAQAIGGAVKPSPGTADTTPPSSSIACNGAACSTGLYIAPVQVTLSATDTGGSGLEAIRYTTDGSDPTLASPVYTAPFTVSATTTVKYRAWDNAGNAGLTSSQLIAIEISSPDTTAPTSSIACNGAACSTDVYNASVQVTLSATDDLSGVAAIRYTTNGTDPTPSSPLYTAPFTVSVTTTVKYRAFDNAGNVELTKSTLIRIDTAAPTVTITSPANGAFVTGSVKVSATASETGSGVARVDFYVDGISVATVTKAPYTFRWNTKKVSKGKHTLTATAVDLAGNSASTSITVTVT